MAAPRIPLTFLSSPTTALTWYPPSTRVLTACLSRNPRLDATLSDVSAHIFFDAFRAHRRAVRRLEETDALGTYLRAPLRVAPHLDVAAGLYDDALAAAARTELVCLSALTAFDLPVARRLLAAGKRVVLGGSVATHHTPAQLRDLLRRMGAPVAALERDLIVVSGCLGPETDLAALIDDWRDAEVHPADHALLFSGVEDFLRPFVPLVNQLTPQRQVALSLSTGCWYGRCHFCSARRQPAHDFTLGVAPELIAGHLRELAAAYQTRALVLTDNFLRFTPGLAAVLEARRPVEVTVYTGVALLTDPEYVRAANRLVDGLRVGVESASDFTLEAVGKGFTCAALERAVANLERHLDRDKALTLLIVYDLPAESREEVRRSYARLVELKARLLKAGFRRVTVAGFPLMAFPDTALPGRSAQLEVAPRASLDDEALCGAWVLGRWFERARGVALPDELEVVLAAYRRRDAAGALLPSDFALLDAETVAFLEDL